MLRHCVFMRFRNDLPKGEIDGIFADLRSVQQYVPGFLDMECGPNAEGEGLSNGYQHGFTMDFTDADALAAYGAHPVHEAARLRLLAACADVDNAVLVFDLEF